MRKGPRPSREEGRKGRRKGGRAGGVRNEGIAEGVRNGGREGGDREADRRRERERVREKSWILINLCSQFLWRRKETVLSVRVGGAKGGRNGGLENEGDTCCHLSEWCQARRGDEFTNLVARPKSVHYSKHHKYYYPK